MEIKENIPLAPYTTFKIGGPAKYFFEAETNEDLIEVVKWAKRKNLPFFILGGGSNVLVSDKGFKGLAIKMKNEKLAPLDTKLSNGVKKMKNENKKSKIIEAGAGVKLENLVKLAARNSLAGIEWTAGIPGTVGGAVYGNAAAFRKSMAEVVKNLEILKITQGDPVGIERFKNKDCQFGYKDSIFKKNKNLIILSCLLELKKGNKKEIKEKIKYFLDYREKNHPLNFSSAGSIFKNPSNISAGELVEECGLKGKTIGRAQISKKHANFIINLGGATAKDVLKLINLIKKEVKEKFGIKLEEEVQYLGF